MRRVMPYGGGNGNGDVLGVGDLNGSLDASMMSIGNNVDTTGRFGLESRKSLNLNSSGLGRMSFIKSGVVPTGSAKKPMFGRPSIAMKENNDRCVIVQLLFCFFM